MAKLAFLGTGLLGGAFAEAAAKRGDTVVAWNRSKEKAQALAPFGVVAAATPAAAVVGAARVHLILRDDAVVDEVIAAARPGLAVDAILIDHSTTLPALTAVRAERLQAEGLAYLHCPVFMGPAAARSAQGSMLVSGPQSVFERVRADLEKMTGRLEYLGERADLAAVYKLLGNAMFIGSWGVLADILTVARGGGVAAADAIKMLSMLDLNAIVSGRGMNMARGNFEPTFELTMALKDAQLMIETAGELPLAALPSVAARMEDLIAAGYGDRDPAVLAIDAVRDE